MREEIFGPVVTAYVYPDSGWDDVLRIVDTSTPYALTGSVFATDRAAVRQAMSALRNAAGNFYVNDKPTGAVVGQQPFGGARGSGTNDKAGSKMNLLRWVSARTVKENFVPPTRLHLSVYERGIAVLTEARSPEPEDLLDPYQDRYRTPACPSGIRLRPCRPGPAGIQKRVRSPSTISCTPSFQPRITSSRLSVAGVPRTTELSNILPSVVQPV